jgi:cytoskeletal protein CcmA (bactofilin family)
MFTDKKNNQNQDLERNIISKNTSISGDIHSEGDFRIDGTVECSNADIEGDFFGKLIVSELLSLKSTAKINGEVFINKLSVEPNATFNATCSMKSGVKELNTNERKKAGKTA